MWAILRERNSNKFSGITSWYWQLPIIPAENHINEHRKLTFGISGIWNTEQIRNGTIRKKHRPVGRHAPSLDSKSAESSNFLWSIRRYN
jgi:hypothetical protein